MCQEQVRILTGINEVSKKGRPRGRLFAFCKKIGYSMLAECKAPSLWRLHGMRKDNARNGLIFPARIE
jgi:hypothetical protein